MNNEITEAHILFGEHSLTEWRKFEKALGELSMKYCGDDTFYWAFHANRIEQMIEADAQKVLKRLIKTEAKRRFEAEKEGE